MFHCFCKKNFFLKMEDRLCVLKIISFWTPDHKITWPYLNNREKALLKVLFESTATEEVTRKNI